MYVDWEYYKIFYYVAKYQNFTRAARVLGNNQPNITHAMNRLESQLNCVLFIRSNRGVTLTPEGELLYSRIASAAVQIQDAEEELSATATLEHGAISISTTETALNIYHVFVRRFFTFVTRSAGITVSPHLGMFFVVRSVGKPVVLLILYLVTSFARLTI